MLMSGLRDLPPLDLLTAFEAAARLGSFTRAAEELGVTQSAISQRIRGLEQAMGAQLFERRHRAVALTQAGRDLQNGVVAALDHLVAATAAARRGTTPAQVRVATDQSVAEMWLGPRLSALFATVGDLSLALHVSDDIDTCLSAEADLKILHGRGDWPGYRCTLLLADQIFPVAAPGLQDPDDAPLLDLDYERWGWMNWSIWMTETGNAPGAARIGLHSNAYPRLIEAARQGLGIALGWQAFVADDLASGQLVRIGTEIVRPGLGYYLLEPFNVPVSAPTRAICDWIRDAAC